MGLEAPVRRTVHASGGESTVHAQLGLACLDIIGHLLQIVKALDIVLGVTSGTQQLLVVDDAVGLNDVCNAGDSVAVLQAKESRGQFAVQLAAGQVVAVILQLARPPGR